MSNNKNKLPKVYVDEKKYQIKIILTGIILRKMEQIKEFKGIPTTGELLRTALNTYCDDALSEFKSTILPMQKKLEQQELDKYTNEEYCRRIMGGEIEMTNDKRVWCKIPFGAATRSVPLDRIKEQKPPEKPQKQ